MDVVTPTPPRGNHNKKRRTHLNPVSFGTMDLSSLLASKLTPSSGTPGTSGTPGIPGQENQWPPQKSTPGTNRDADMMPPPSTKGKRRVSPSATNGTQAKRARTSTAVASPIPVWGGKEGSGIPGGGGKKRSHGAFSGDLKSPRHATPRANKRMRKCEASTASESSFFKEPVVHSGPYTFEVPI